MSHSVPLSLSPSPEFIALCQAQIALLAQELQAAWSIVYLSRGWVQNRETQLIPVASYPSRESAAQSEYLRDLPRIWLENASAMALPDVSSAERELSREGEDALKVRGEDLTQGGQIILPLIYEQRMMGLLVTRRNEREWEQRELDQIKKIARTIAIACYLDQRQQWYEEQLKEQHSRQKLERNRLDNLLHQLRNPLTALKTFGKLLFKRFLPEDSNQPIIRGILRESDRLQELLEEFEAEIERQTQETSTIEILPEATNAASVRFLLPRSSVTLEPVSVNEIIEPLIDSGQAIAQDKKITLISHIPSDLPLVQANSKALREVFSNLIDNALKYTPTEGQVSFSSQLRSDDLAISISDTGYGIPVGDREHLFQRHYRGVQAQGDIPGTGLGLAIARELIEQMDGKIEIVSPVTEDFKFPGTTFTVRLPLAEEV